MQNRPVRQQRKSAGTRKPFMIAAWGKQQNAAAGSQRFKRCKPEMRHNKGISAKAGGKSRYGFRTGQIRVSAFRCGKIRSVR